GRRRVAATLGDLLLALVPLAVLVLVLAPPAPLEVAGAWWPLAVAVALALPAGWWALRSLPQLHDAELRERGPATVVLRGASLSMDTRALGRALDTQSRRTRRRSAQLRALPRLVGALGPGAALAAADTLLLLRSPRRLVQILCGAAIALAAPSLPQVPS